MKFITIFTSILLVILGIVLNINILFQTLCVLFTFFAFEGKDLIRLWFEKSSESKQ